MNTENYMLIIPTKWLVNDGDAAPDGTTIVECKKCNRKFAVPTEEVAKEPEMCCEECLAAESINDMKSGDSEANNTINAALGQ